MHLAKPHTQREHDCDVLCSLSGTVARRILSSCLTFQFLLRKLLSDCQANIRVFFDLAPRPYTELQNQLELLRKIVPAVVVAGDMGRQEVLCCMDSSGTVRQNMVSMPASTYVTPADVALPSGLSQNCSSLLCGQPKPTRPSIGILALLAKSAQRDQSIAEFFPFCFFRYAQFRFLHRPDVAADEQRSAAENLFDDAGSACSSRLFACLEASIQMT